MRNPPFHQPTLNRCLILSITSSGIESRPVYHSLRSVGTVAEAR